MYPADGVVAGALPVAEHPDQYDLCRHTASPGVSLALVAGPGGSAGVLKPPAASLPRGLASASPEGPGISGFEVRLKIEK